MFEKPFPLKKYLDHGLVFPSVSRKVEDKKGKLVPWPLEVSGTPLGDEEIQRELEAWFDQFKREVTLWEKKKVEVEIEERGFLESQLIPFLYSIQRDLDWYEEMEVLAPSLPHVNTYRVLFIINGLERQSSGSTSGKKLLIQFLEDYGWDHLDPEVLLRSPREVLFFVLTRAAFPPVNSTQLRLFSRGGILADRCWVSSSSSSSSSSVKRSLVEKLLNFLDLDPETLMEQLDTQEEEWYYFAPEYLSFLEKEKKVVSLTDIVKDEDELKNKFTELTDNQLSQIASNQGIEIQPLHHHQFESRKEWILSCYSLFTKGPSFYRSELTEPVS